MIVRLRLPSMLCLTLIAVALAASAAVGGEPAARSAKLEVQDVRFDPIAAGKNTLSVTVRNLTDRAQVLKLDIRTQPGAQGGGWQTQFPEDLGPRDQKTLRFGYAFSAAPQAEGFVRLRFYDFLPVEDQQFREFFQEIQRSVSQIGLRGAEPPASAASPEVTRSVLGQFARFQEALRDRKYDDAWELLTTVCRQAGFMNRRDGPLSFTWQMGMDPSPASWSRADVTRLQPISVGVRGDLAILSVKLDDAVWTVELAQVRGKWLLDWINGWPAPPSGRDREARLAALLPRLQKRATLHFDIYYGTDSSAARHIARIAEQREFGYQAINSLLGAVEGPRIRLIFFADANTKTVWAMHQGDGMAYGTTIIEVYNDVVQLDPFHEVTHILTGPAGSPPAILEEGFAVYMSEHLGAPPLKSLGGGGLSTYERVRQLRSEGKWIPLAELLTYTDIGSEQSQPLTAYPEAGAFAKFLVDRYGKEKFLAAFKELRSSDDKSVQRQNVAALERICGKPLSELNREWLSTMGVKEMVAMQTPSGRVNAKPFIAPAEPMAASYTIQCRIDPDRKVVTGSETIRLVNRSSSTLERLALTAGADSQARMDVQIGGQPAHLAPPAPSTATPPPTEALPVEAAFSPANAREPLVVELPKPLAPGEAVTVNVDFATRIPNPFLPWVSLLDWHPKLWWGYPTHDEYEVTVEAPPGWTVIATGLPDRSSQRWTAKQVRTFGIALAQGLERGNAQAGDTAIACFFRPAGRQCAELVLKTAVDVVKYYRSTYGFYPQPFLWILPGADEPMGGFPFATGMVVIHGEERFPDKSLDHWRWITAHEIGHQYWGEHAMAGNLFESWLLIGLGIYMDHTYSRARGLDPEVHRKLVDRYLEGVAQGLDTTAELPTEQIAKINFDRNNVVIHGKGFAIISALESVVGADAFGRVVRDCLRRYYGKRFTANDLQRACEAETGQELSWFFDQWVRSNRQLAYRVASKESTKSGESYLTRVAIERTGSLEMPIPVEVRFEDGSAQRANTNRLGAMSELIFESAAPEKEVVLDPDGALPLRETPVVNVADAIGALPWSGAAEKARELLPQAKEAGLGGFKSWLKLGLNLYDGAIYPEALEAFRRSGDAADAGALRAVAFVWQGHILDVTGRREEAVACYRKAKDIGISDTMRHDQYGMVINADWIEARLATPFERK